MLALAWTCIHDFLLCEQQHLARIKIDGSDARALVSWNDELAHKYEIDTIGVMRAFEGTNKAHEPQT